MTMTKTQRISAAESVMNQRNLGKPVTSAGSHTPIPGVSSDLVVHVQRPSGRGIAGASDVATGRWDAKEQKWVFESSEDALQQWLENTFAQPVIGRAGRSTGATSLPICSIAYLVYMKESMLPRKGLTASWKIEDKSGNGKK